jgi:hypothetical protein
MFLSTPKIATRLIIMDSRETKVGPKFYYVQQGVNKLPVRIISKIKTPCILHQSTRDTRKPGGRQWCNVATRIGIRTRRGWRTGREKLGVR